ncbi:MFS general substrate transporter [Rozella allomycis CSF55]|uniref:Lysosomal dipeptide transporter MFSD1 n=1 Tax=Rozella allomycis (strain CSF55) TaxID=988480 RepID=A0A4P9YAQ7_ROZAC|nr:MFS general substrate transporter [Rozella allomycis CSF55]
MCVFGFACALILVKLHKRFKYQMQSYEKLENRDLDEENEEFNTTKHDGIRERLLLGFPIKFYILILVVMFSYGAINPFVHISSDFYQFKYNFSNTEAGKYMALPDLLSAVLNPFLGYILDKSSFNSKYILPIASIFIAISHFMFAFTNAHVIVCLLIFGLSYSLLAAVSWPLVSVIVDVNTVGKAYGLVSVFLNMALSLFPLLVAYVRVQFGSFIAVEILFIVISLTGTIFSFIFVFIR